MHYLRRDCISLLMIQLYWNLIKAANNEINPIKYSSNQITQEGNGLDFKQ